MTLAKWSLKQPISYSNLDMVLMNVQIWMWEHRWWHVTLHKPQHFSTNERNIFPCNLLSKIIFFKTGSYITNFVHLNCYKRFGFFLIFMCTWNSGKSPWYPLDRRLGGPQSRSGQYGEVKILDPTGTRTPDFSVVQPIASCYTDYATATHTTVEYFKML
jgi:hypothetical protein